MEGLVARLFNVQCFYHIETSQLICFTNQLIDFNMDGTLKVKGLKSDFSFRRIKVSFYNIEGAESGGNQKSILWCLSYEDNLLCYCACYYLIVTLMRKHFQFDS